MKTNIDGKYILYAEDDLEDRETLIEVMKSVDPELEVTCTSNGLEVINFLDNLQSGYKYPCFIILDINMPVQNGIETLSHLKKSNSYNEIPVIIFSTSTNPLERTQAQQLSADMVITKPARYRDLEEITLKFSNFCRVVPDLYK